MARQIRLGVLDQSPIVSGIRPSDAISETLYLAQLAEELGYHRYWLAEHHSISALGDPCPEILLARIGAATRRIRIGTGGVLLPYYSPLKVAEIFRMLEALFPGRVDLGIGRAPGGDMLTAQALTGGRYLDPDRFPDQLQELIGFLSGNLPPGHPFARVKAMPSGDTVPEVWLLGSSHYSGLLAAHAGTRFAFAHFISAHGGDEVARLYRQRFTPSAELAQPISAVCAFVVCAATRAEAERIALTVDLRRVHMARNVDAPFPTLAEAERYRFDEPERAYAAEQRARLVLGDPAQVRDQLLALREDFQADELLVLTITGDPLSRRQSYRLVAEAFD